MLGYYEFDLTQIYQMENHALMHKFLVMNNPDGEDFGEVTAYLKVSITVSGGDDVPVPIEDDPHPD